MLLIGDHSYSAVESLVEGENILKMQCVVSNEALAQLYSAVGQAANAETMGAGAGALMRSDVASGLYSGFAKLIQTPLEHPPMSQSDVDKRVEYEKKNRDGTQVRANVTVQGWVRPGGALRRCGDDVYINSPSAMLTGLIMKIQTLTFQQDNQSGTTTVLELVMPWMLSDKPFSAVGQSAADVLPSTGNTPTGRSPGPV